MAEFDPSEALTRARCADQAAWDAIVGRYSNLIWTVARSFRLGPADAADVYQATWLRLVEHLDGIRHADRLGAWLSTTARRESLALLRRGRHDQPDADVESLPGASRQPVRSTEDELLRKEEFASLWRGFTMLPENCQRLLRLVFADPPATYAEVGAALDMPVGSIGPARARCLAVLQSRLAH